MPVVRVGLSVAGAHRMAQVELAQRVGVAKSTVSGWAKRLQAGGLDALRSERALGRPASLEPVQRGEMFGR